MSDNQVDINEVLAKLLQNEIESIFDSVKEFVSKPIKEFRTSFKKYLSTSYNKISQTKTLLYKDSPVSLNDIYVDIDLECKNENLKLEQIVNSLEPKHKYIISASAGAGKSVLAKKLFMLIIKKENKGIPIFYELRNLNNLDIGIIDALIELLDSYGITLNEEYFKKLLNKSKFVLILDGYDEIDHSSKMKIDVELKKFSDKFQNTPIFITTRPDDQLEALINYDVLKVKPLDKKLAISLVEKLKYDSKIKDKFIQQLDKELFDKHTDFLSNPLLLTIMLITYSQIAEIPEKMHIFYEQAFDALFFKHDALKGMYKRDLKTKLSIDDFKKVLSIISITSYLKNQINFSNSSLVEHIRNAKKLASLHFNNDDYKYDLLKSVCIIVNDGTNYTFTHRSFQEYFSALFISVYNLSKKEDLLRKILSRKTKDSVLPLAFEMNTSNIEKNLIIPLGDEYISKYDSSKSEADKLKICFNKIRATNTIKSKSHNYYVKEETIYWYFLIFFENIYSSRYKYLAPKYRTTLTKKSFLEYFGEGTIDKMIIISDTNIDLFKKIGIVEIQEKRVKFLRDILERIKKTNSEIEVSIEQFL